MRIVRIVGIGLLLVIVLAVAVGIGGLAWITARALPQTSGDLAIPGLHGEVSVARDVNGLVAITATDPHDLFVAQGFVHAQERMWQMEVWRHIGAGRLAELFGAGSVDTDRFIRTVGWHRAAERDLAAASPELLAVLTAYADGVNAWLDGHRGSLGLAFLVTGDDPEPWTPLDTLAWGKVQAWNLGGNMDTELFRYLADARLGDPARTDELLAPREFGPVIAPTRDDGEPVDETTGATGGGAVPAGDTVPAGGPTAGAVAEGTAKGSAPLLPPGAAEGWAAVAAQGAAAMRLAGLDASGRGLADDAGIGSNAWVVRPDLSSTGGALLANDPHLGISMPSIWFVNGLHCQVVDAACPFDVAGVSFPGVPGVVLGHNAHLAWGVTNADPDVQDLVVETVDPADPGRYVGPDGASRPFETRTEEIRVDGADPVTLIVRETVHGPILNGVDDRLDGAPLMALRWTAIHPDAGPDGTFEAFLHLDTATSVADARTALATYVAPAQNVVLADTDGTIGYQLAGYIPIRSDPEDRGARPVSGSDGNGEWVGRIPVAEMPAVSQPDDGWIVTANNAIVDEGYPGFIGQEWDPGYRAERIIDLVNAAADDGVTLEELGRIQSDTSPLRGRDIVGLLEDAQPATEDGQTIARRISDWDGRCDVESLGCAAYLTWEYHLLRAIFDDDLGPGLAREYVGSALSWVALTRLLDDPSAAWWDDVTTPVVETADQVVLGAMDAAGADLRGTYGDPDRWSWGRLHTATFKEQTIGANSGIGPLEWYFNDGPVAVGGAAGAPDATSYRFLAAYPDPADPSVVPAGIDELFSVTALPSYRLLVDLSDLDGARIVITTGQSGNPFDRHYSDLVDPWRRGESVPLPFSRAAIEAATVAELRLHP